MFRNAESHFAQVPNIDIQRSKMRIPFEHKTTFNVGDIIPIYFDGDVLPGDSIKMTHSAVVRLQTLLTPIMDNLVLDFYWFFVPYRLVWDRWREFMKENTSGPWVQNIAYNIPTISAPSGGFAVGSVADYLGYPTGINWSNTDMNAPSALPLRGYAEICTEFFRDENLTYPLNVPKDSSNQTGTNGTNYINDVANGGMPFKAAKTHDYFTSCLPSAQKATQPVTLNMFGDAPVYADAVSGVPSSSEALKWYNVNTGNVLQPSVATVLGVDNASGHVGDTMTRTGLSGTVGVQGLAPANLIADLSQVSAITVNQLRLAFQLQKWYETAARSGTRYTELIRGMFSVISPDARLQRPEYLGGNRVAIAINEVTNLSSDSGSQSVPLGNVAANSNTSDVNTDFVHSFTEHGMLYGLAVVRIANHTYSQGMPRSFLRKDFTSFYWPVFAHLGEQSVPKVCIYADGNMNSNTAFGYQEAWAEYRYHPNRTSGEMRPQAANTLSSWHLGDYYTSAPTLSDGWIREGTAEVDRVLAVTSAVSNNLLGDFYFEAEYTRPMPVYSVPGLIDHF